MRRKNVFHVLFYENTERMREKERKKEREKKYRVCPNSSLNYNVFSFIPILLKPI